MIRVSEDDPIGEVALSFPYRDVQIKRNIDPKTLYTLDSELGRGKFGTVYKCRETATGLEMAAKFVGVPKKEDRRNVEREIDIMKQLQHPRLLQLYDAFENGKVMCLILELIEGGELFERVIDDDFVLTEKSCTIFMRQICDGVDFIHKQRILHLDMKPENILCLTKTGNRIKIIDFGLARRFDPDKKLQVLFGTPEFVAPEVVNFDEIGFGTDMWSVGVICYVLLSGLSPFMGHTDIETMANVTIAKYDFDDEAFQDISENAKDFIKKLLVKDMKSRMSAEECLNHVWLKKKPPQLPQERPDILEVGKDNLKQFVERWTEHPDSPYVFELTSHTIMPSHREEMHLSSSFHSLTGMSPSPCGSLSSSLGSNDAFTNEDVSNGLYELDVPLDHLRRASDSSCIIKKMDVCERVNLAEEIKKLSDKLFQLSTMPTQLKTNDTETLEMMNFNGIGEFHTTKTKPKTPDSGSIKFVDPFDTKLVETISVNVIEPEKIVNPCSRVPSTLPKSSPIHIKQTNSSHSAHNSSPCNVPWRRTKFRINNTSRDVPLAFKTVEKPLNEQVSTSQERSPSGTKDMLLRLLNRWDNSQAPPRTNIRHGSVSSELSENDAVGQKSISSINSFFQSRVNKKILGFHKT